MSIADESSKKVPLTGADVIRQFIPTSPYIRYLGIQLVEIKPGQATLLLPFRNEVITREQVVHGGAISSLIDVAGMAAAWSDAEVPERIRGSTVNLTVSYLAPAVASDLRAVARVLRRGRSLVYLDVEVYDAANSIVAKGIATYKLG
ncbi:PaaI family thioesterase [Ktedonospora formicarum]|uniref:Thioesterase n=1 Tax=Ktedonospora formicarum TaxID=2778364 RepID=A0A8J3I6M5_9CHLR|nr:PaaI family thioesterase [Ktedonospora formicarum]GHO46833.1 thioesterase [Ktedonospora formicarum]